MQPGGHVYILGSATGTLYIGVTSDLYQRIQQHKSGQHPGFSRDYRCHRLLFAEPHPTITEAIVREKQLKGWRREKKIALIRTINPTFRDLAEHWGWQSIHRDERMADYDQRIQLPIQKLPGDSS